MRQEQARMRLSGGSVPFDESAVSSVSHLEPAPCHARDHVRRLLTVRASNYTRPLFVYLTLIE